MSDLLLFFLCFFLPLVLSGVAFFFVVVLPLIIDDRRDRRRRLEELKAQAYIENLRFLRDHPEYKIYLHMGSNKDDRIDH